MTLLAASKPGSPIPISKRDLTKHHLQETTGVRILFRKDLVVAEDLIFVEILVLVEILMLGEDITIIQDLASTVGVSAEILQSLEALNWLAGTT